LAGPANITALTVGITNLVALPAQNRRYLAILNQSTTAVVYIAFDTPAIAAVAGTAGQITLEPITSSGGGQTGFTHFEWMGGFVPGNQINLIASAPGTPVTLMW
jgi:hypothetical protein